MDTPQPNIQTVDIETLVPYWRNPRKNDVAVEKVKASIQEYGYQTPIIVDAKMTIITGHSRYRALKELGYTQIPVIIADMPEKKAKEFRIIDNRTSEYATWTNELSLELKEFSSPEFRDIFFPDIKLDPNFQALVTPHSQEKIDKAEDDILSKFQNYSDGRDNEPRVTVYCPNCTEEITFTKTDLMKDKSWTI